MRHVALFMFYCMAGSFACANDADVEVPSLGTRVLLKDPFRILEAPEDVPEFRRNLTSYLVVELDLSNPDRPKAKIQTSGKGVAGWVDVSEIVPEDKANEYYSNRISKDPGDINALLSRGMYWNDRNELEKAIADYDEVIRIDPAIPMAHIFRAKLKIRRAEYDQAIADCTEAIRRSPEYDFAYSLRGNAWRAKGEYDKALADYESAIRISPEFTEALVNRGIVLYEMKRTAEAFADFDAAIRIDPGESFAYRCRGIFNDEIGNQDQALKDLDTAIRLNPAETEAIWNRGRIRMRRKETDKALSDFDTLLRLDPSHHDARILRAFILRKAKRFGDALSDYSIILEHEPETWIALLGKGQTLFQTQDFEQSAKYFHAVVLSDNAVEKYRTTAAVLEILSLRRAGRLEEANAAARHAADARKTDSWPAPIVQFMAGLVDEAGLLELADDNVKRTEVRCFLGLHELASGKVQSARSHFEWVRTEGEQNTIEFELATNELNHLNGPSDRK